MSTETTTATVTVNGSTKNVSDGTDFRDAAVTAARDAGFGKFRVFLNGSEIDPADAPTELSAGMALEIRPFEEAGAGILFGHASA